MKTLVCTLRYIRGKWSEAAYNRRATGEGATFRERKRSRVTCTICGVTVESPSLIGYIVRQYVKIPL